VGIAVLRLFGERFEDDGDEWGGDVHGLQRFTRGRFIADAPLVVLQRVLGGHLLKVEVVTSRHHAIEQRPQRVHVDPGVGAFAV
jgi:hypothetical protein